MIKFIIARGIGFSPGSVGYIPTLGFSFDIAATFTTGGESFVVPDRKTSFQVPYGSL